MSSVIRKLSAQVAVALEFLNASSSDPASIRKAFHSISAIQKLIEEVNNELSQIGAQKQENQKLLDSVADLSNKLSLMRLANNVSKTDIEKMRNKMNQLNIDLQKLTSERTELEKTISTLKKDHIKAIKEVKEASKEKSQKAVQKQKDKVVHLTEVEQSLRRQVKELQSIVDESFGKEAVSVEGATQGVRFFLHLYERRLPMVIRNDKHKIKMLEDVHWHFQVMRNNGVAVIALTTEWLTPIFPACNDFDSEWLERNSLVLHALMMERAKESHPLQYKMALAAKKLKLLNNDLLLDDEKVWLKAARMESLFDAIGLGFQIFLVLIDTAVPNLEYKKAETLFNKLLEISEQLKGICKEGG